MNYELDRNVPLATSTAYEGKSRKLITTILMPMPCQGKMAIGLPSRVIGRTTPQNAQNTEEELTTGSDDRPISLKG